MWKFHDIFPVFFFFSLGILKLTDVARIIHVQPKKLGADQSSHEEDMTYDPVIEDAFDENLIS
jgi:hypothetical protein